MKKLDLLAATLRAGRRAELGSGRNRRVRPRRDHLRPGVRRDERREPDRLRPRRPRSRLRRRLARAQSRGLAAARAHLFGRTLNQLTEPHRTHEKGLTDMRRTRFILALLAVTVVTVAAGSPASADSRKQGDIVSTAVGAGQFTTLASLLKKAGLVGTLQGKGPFTVLAPTDAAFAKVPKSDARCAGRQPGEAPIGPPVPRDRGQGSRSEGGQAALCQDPQRTDRAASGSPEARSSSAAHRSPRRTWLRRTASSTSSTRCSSLASGSELPLNNELTSD